MNEGYDAVYTHLDSGLMRWRIALFQCAEEFPRLVQKLFLFNKMTAEMEVIRIFYKLNETEAQVLQVLSNYTKITLSDLRGKYLEAYSDRTLSAILKVVRSLAEGGLVIENKEGRVQWVELTDLGRAMMKSEEFITDITQKLSN
jgi:predicted transcriptional regulator